MRPITVLLLAAAFQIVTSIDPECYMTVPEIARHFGFESEIHIVRTPDDYLLELHRIRAKNITKTKAAVFMQHGLLSDGFTWIPNLPDQSAGFIFASEGYDVWIGNSRGSPPSQKHIGYGPEDARFWNFSWQEMSELDLTSSVDYVLKETNESSLYYLGHSQGTMIMFARLSEDPVFSKKIRQFHALAPVATVSHIGGLFKYFGQKFLDFVEFLLKRTPYTPLGIPKFIQKIIGKFCSQPFLRNVCTLDIGFIDGSETQFNMSRVGVFSCHLPAATSVKDLDHWIQLAASQKVQKYDYGADENMKRYGNVTPPVYNLSTITAPTFLYWSKDDILADTQDIRETIMAQMKDTIKGSYEMPHYTHMDFVYGMNAKTDLYPIILENIKKDLFLQQKTFRMTNIYHERVYR